MPPVEAWEKVLVSAEFVESTHGSLGCRHCHGGPDGENEKEAAHVGLIARPSEGEAQVCQPCHSAIVSNFPKSLHATQNGYFTMFAARSGRSPDDPQYAAMFESRCAECHASCGACHIVRPEAVDGGLTRAHDFRKTPLQTENCTACHGSRVGDEFRGRNEGIAEDVHYLRGMNCMSCHSGMELHGDGTTPSHRQDNVAGPQCTTCHPDAASAESTVVWHAQHAGKLACQVCHAQPYKNCYVCHVELDSQGIQFPSRIDFRIGHNPKKSAARPEEWVLLRHIPIAPDTFAAWGITLPEYAAEPTWRLATPHNIVRSAPQTSACDNCHGSDELFLTPAHIQELINEGVMVNDEIEANESVVVDDPPGEL